MEHDASRRRFPRWQGLIAAPFTPFHDDGTLNLARVPDLVAQLVAQGVAGAFVAGTTGESLLLTVEEREALAEAWQSAAAGRLAVIVHVGHPAPASARRLAAHAQRLGVAAIGAMPPVFFQPGSVAELVACCRAIAGEAPELPFYYYHIPAKSGVAFPMYDFLQAAGDSIPTLAGIKFTYENLMDYDRCRRLDGGRFQLLFGRDELLLAGLALGAEAAVGSTYNYMARIYTRLIAAFQQGDLATARQEQAVAIDVIALLARYGGLRAHKAVMRLIGVDCGPPRPPMAPLSPTELDALHADLQLIGFYAASGAPACSPSI